MSTLETLLKVAQGRLDDVSREASTAAAEMVELKQALGDLDQQRIDAGTFAARDVSLMVAAGDFMGKVRRQRTVLQERIETQRAIVDEIRGRLTRAFQEKSKFEQLIERERVRAYQTELAAEQKMLDEVALQRTGRA